MGIEILLIVLLVCVVVSLVQREAWGPWPGGLLGTILVVVLLLWLLGRV